MQRSARPGVVEFHSRDSGLTAEQVDRLQKEDGIYALSTGRICVVALNTKNIDKVAKAIARVLAQ